MKLGGMAQKVIGALASGSVSRGSTNRGMGRSAEERDSEPPPNPLADQRRQRAAADVSRPLDIRSLTQSRARNIDTNQAERDAQLAEAMAGIEGAGYAAAGRPGGTSSAEYMERIRRARGY